MITVPISAYADLLQRSTDDIIVLHGRLEATRLRCRLLLGALAGQVVLFAWAVSYLTIVPLLQFPKR